MAKGAPKGHPRYGGRAKGVPNKPTQDLMAICEARGLNVFEAMAELACNEKDLDKRFHRLSEMAKYLYPKRKEVEMSGGLEPIEVILRDYTSKK